VCLEHDPQNASPAPDPGWKPDIRKAHAATVGVSGTLLKQEIEKK
jgi:hypothetical protein